MGVTPDPQLETTPDGLLTPRGVEQMVAVLEALAAAEAQR